MEHNDNSGYNGTVKVCLVKRVAAVQLQDLNKSGYDINRLTYQVAITFHTKFQIALIS